MFKCQFEVSIGEEQNLSVFSCCDLAVWHFQQNYEVRIKMLRRDDINYKTWV